MLIIYALLLIAALIAIALIVDALIQLGQQHREAQASTWTIHPPANHHSLVERAHRGQISIERLWREADTLREVVAYGVATHATLDRDLWLKEQRMRLCEDIAARQVIVERLEAEYRAANISRRERRSISVRGAVQGVTI